MNAKHYMVKFEQLEEKFQSLRKVAIDSSTPRLVRHFFNIDGSPKNISISKAVRVSILFISPLKINRVPTVPRINTAPGYGLANIARWLFSKKNYERCFEPLLADLQFEYCEAIKSGAEKKAKWIHVKYIFAFFKSILFFIPTEIIQKIAVKFFTPG